MGRWPLGAVDVAWYGVPVEERARQAAALGFEHLDVLWSDAEVVEPIIPVGDVVSFPSPRSGCSTPAPSDGPGMWDRALTAYRRTPGMLLEPWGGSIVNSIEKVRAMVEAVPGLRLLVDTGHVAGWGEDPCDLLAFGPDVVAHVQLRQARHGTVQVHVDDGGDVDFAALFGALDGMGYAGKLSVEYFDLPDLGWPLDDPVGCAVALRDAVRPLL